MRLRCSDPGKIARISHQSDRICCAPGALVHSYWGFPCLATLYYYLGSRQRESEDVSIANSSIGFIIFHGKFYTVLPVSVACVRNYTPWSRIL